MGGRGNFVDKCTFDGGKSAVRPAYRGNLPIGVVFEFMLKKLDFMVLTILKVARMFRRTSRDDLFPLGARSSAGRATDF